MTDCSEEEAARRAGEAFVAASRAESAEDRKRHRAEAERYVEMLRRQEQARIEAAIAKRGA